jgi:hypothetical protein
LITANINNSDIGHAYVVSNTTVSMPSPGTQAIIDGRSGDCVNNQISLEDLSDSSKLNPSQPNNNETETETIATITIKFKNTSLEFPNDSSVYEFFNKNETQPTNDKFKGNDKFWKRVKSNFNMIKSAISMAKDNKQYYFYYHAANLLDEMKNYYDLKIKDFKKTMKNRRKRMNKGKNKAAHKIEFIKNALTNFNVLNYLIKYPVINVYNKICFYNEHFSIYSNEVSCKNTNHPETFTINKCESIQYNNVINKNNNNKDKIKDNDKYENKCKNSKQQSKRRCYYCKNKGHYIGQCPTRIKDETKQRNIKNAIQYVSKCSVRNIINGVFQLIKDEIKIAKEQKCNEYIIMNTVDEIYQGIFTKIKMRNTTCQQICHKAWKFINQCINKIIKKIKNKDICKRTVFLKLREKVDRSNYAKDQLRQQVKEIQQITTVNKHRVTEGMKRRHKKYKLQRQLRIEQQTKLANEKQKQLEEKYLRESLTDNLRQIVNLNVELSKIKFEDIFTNVMNGDTKFQKMLPLKYNSQPSETLDTTQMKRTTRCVGNGRTARTNLANNNYN